MGRNGQQIAVVLPTSARNVSISGVNQNGDRATWKGDPKNWGGVEGGKGWFGALTEGWWFKGGTSIQYEDDTAIQNWIVIVPPDQGPTGPDVWTTTPDNHPGFAGYPK